MENPFTPSFGGKPQFFFGRTRELELIEDAFENEFSPHRVMFITGNRGFGKTALLEHASQMAAKRRWTTIDVHSRHASSAVLKGLVGGDSRTVERSVRPEAFGISVGASSESVTSSFDDSDLTFALLDACKSLSSSRGIFISVDEVQKIAEDDMENLCAAVQMALRKGYPIMMLLAGLPGAKEKVAGYPGCTFMQRARDVQIGGLLVDETVATFRALLKRVQPLEFDEEAIWELSRFSFGHPYLMQLVGFYLVELAGERIPVETAVGPDLVKQVEPEAYAAYKANVLDPVFSSLGAELRGYLQSMARLLDEEGRAGTGAVAEAMDKTAQQCSSYRSRLIAKRLIADDGWGYVRFTLPHTTAYFKEGEQAPRERNPQEWNVY